VGGVRRYYCARFGFGDCDADYGVTDRRPTGRDCRTQKRAMSDLGQFILIHFAVHVPPLAGGVIAIIVLVVIIHLFRDRIF